MRITQLEAIPVRVPLKAGMVTKTAHGDHHTSDYVIVKLHTEEGLVGLGEATVSALWSGETSKGCVAALRDLIGPALAGADPFQITAIRKSMDFLLKLNPFTKAAVEMALWDLAGKALGIPVYQLLGGKVRDSIPTKMMIGAFDLPRVRSLAEQFLGWGVRCLKVKVGLDLPGDIARVHAVRDVAGPDVPITIDANCGWNVTTARVALAQLKQFNLLVAEQPIGPGDTEAMSSLRWPGGIPIMADESVFSLADAWNVLRGTRPTSSASIRARMVESPRRSRSPTSPSPLVSPAMSEATSSWASARRRCSIWRLPCRTSTARPIQPISSVPTTTKPTCSWSPWRSISSGARVPIRPGSRCHY